MYTFYLADENATEELAARMAVCLIFPLVFTLSGEIGAGKTSFVRALLRGLGIDGPVKSPTFSLLESYQYKDWQIHHFDLYRIHDETELEYIGFRDFFTQRAFCCIEWPERAPHSLPRVDIHGVLAISGEGRSMSLYPSTGAGEMVLSCLTDQP
ncbi:tRNA (adenosine(37)-N6)-threonylcarbamoyltransferase complex ATPase subunit type 1 TsaE [Legionella spiritensis]|uniref:tRNA threonylcarbamoyladenosine biosynthesis protein TsaE n=1 Tax=Legionella spiritensis TaxID=452 RepID=A0A0W0Z5G8_LEGSP|nr:tRNA (adenosine(37)-N6)-threonylcarbamoyltransferase complex ATPase subunit type 1 TsaE [Legionella spiritensis]KTD64379.1 ATPase or kinase [Legionella spiritensis]SNV46212.1 ATPase or kinase [Legionella spiritensis]VEG91056.1 ATPase or kinase [Legionella spiritensis]